MPTLVVEPDGDLAEMLAFILRREGHDVMLAANAHAAAARIAAKAPGLVISAITLPVGSGVALCAGLRQAGSQIPVLLLSDGSEEEHVRGLEAGAAAVLSKPVSPRLFRAQVATVVQQAALRAGDISV